MEPAPLQQETILPKIMILTSTPKFALKFAEKLT